MPVPGFQIIPTTVPVITLEEPSVFATVEKIELSVFVCIRQERKEGASPPLPPPPSLEVAKGEMYLCKEFSQFSVIRRR